METAFVCVVAVLLDFWLGQPLRWHPLIGFQRLATAVEESARRRPSAGQGLRRIGLLVLPPVLAAAVSASVGGVFWDVFVVYLALGGSRLVQTARSVEVALERRNMPLARERIRLLAPARGNATDIAGAAVASVLKGGNTALVGVLFWYLLLGVGGAVLYRLAEVSSRAWNRSPSGHAARVLEALLSWLPARLTALSYILLGNGKSGWKCWLSQGRSGVPDTAPLLAAGSGALMVQLDGRHVAGAAGVVGEGFAPRAVDVRRATRLVKQSAWLWLAVIASSDLLVF